MLAEALALLAALLASAPDGATPVVEIHPAVVVLGRGYTARVVVRSPGGAPRLVTSVGTVGAAREVAPGVFEAVLAPPLEAHPQLALVAALAPGGVGFAWLPLIGRGLAIAHTEPYAKITVDIRGRVFGPALADQRGVAQVPVEVPPGVRFVRHRGRPLDLRVPPLRQAHVIVDRASLRADWEETVTVYAFTATPEGAPWAGAPLSLSVSAGTLDEPRVIAPGAVAAAWTLPPGPAGEAAVEARLPGVPAARGELLRVAGSPARVAIRLGAERVLAGDPSVDVLVEVSDDAGNRVDGEVGLSATFGALSRPVRDGPGLLHAWLSVPERLEGRVEAAVEARLGEAVDRRALALSPAEPASLEVKVDRHEMPADGSATAGVRVALADRFGNGIDEPPPSIEAERGSVAPISRDGPGIYRTRYAAERLRLGGQGAVIARAGGLVATAPVRLLAPPRQTAATIRAGALHAFGGFTAPYLAAGLEGWPHRLGGAWGLALGLGLAASSQEASIGAGGGPHAVRSSSVLWPIEVTALARRRLRPRLDAEGGVGAGAVGIRSRVELDGARTADEWGWAPSLHATGGVALEVPAWGVRVRLDARVGWQGDAGMRSFRGALGTFALALGVSRDAL